MLDEPIIWESVVASIGFDGRTLRSSGWPRDAEPRDPE
jgi:hypothetical protein